jgi:antitoxin (DNA-binding transcriptional repressor) of toxin-antitoxin stability system
MARITHRELRVHTGEILRRVANGETIEITKHGQLAARLVLPGSDTLADLIARGQVRVAQRPVSDLRSIVRRKSNDSAESIVADVRGRS